EEIAVDYEERLEKHKEVVAAGRVAQEQDVEYDDIAERRELESLEKEIVGEVAKPEPEEPVAQPEMPEPKLIQPPRRVPIDEAMQKPAEKERKVEDDEEAVVEDRPLELE